VRRLLRWLRNIRDRAHDLGVIEDGDEIGGTLTDQGQ